MKSIIISLIVCLVSVNAKQEWQYWNNTSGSNNSVNETSQWNYWNNTSGFNNYSSQYNSTSYRKRDASSVITGLGNQLGLSSSLVSQIIGQYNSLNIGINYSFSLKNFFNLLL